MIWARPLRPLDSSLSLAFSRLGLPRSAREYAEGKLPYSELLLTGLQKAELSFLRSTCEGSEAPGREEFPRFVPGDREKRPGAALIAGRREQLDRLVDSARQGHPALASALEAGLRAGEPPSPLALGGKTFAFGERTFLMGVVNVTPDSFSDGGRFFGADAAVAHGEALAKAGADLLDIGGESTRPGAPAVSVEEELRRVLPVIRGLRERTDAPISIDTTKAEVAREALAAGASLVNDISGFHFDDRLPKVAAEAGAACCLMHIQGTPGTMQKDPRYDDLVEEVLVYLSAGVDRAVAAGVSRERILLDPGIGFGKTLGHNLFLLRRLHELRVLGLPLLVGTSRKSFIGKLTGDRPASERAFGTAGSVAAMAVMGGADVVRVHDVAEMKDALSVADAIRGGKDGGALFHER